MSDEIFDALADMLYAFPRFFTEISKTGKRDEVMRTYARNLRDFPPETVQHACVQLMRTEEFFPTIAKIRRLCTEQQLALPDESQALQQIQSMSAWHANRDGDPPPLHTLVRDTLDLVGGFSAWRTTEEPSVLLGQFGRLYREARARTMREMQAGGPLQLEWPTRKQLNA